MKMIKGSRQLAVTSLAVLAVLLLSLSVHAHANPYQANNTYLDVTFNEAYSQSGNWQFQWQPGEWASSCYSEHFAVYSASWGENPTKESEIHFTVNQLFEDSPDGRTAVLTYTDLRVTRQIYVPTGDEKYFTITYKLTNTNATSTLSDVRFFEAVDYDIVTTSDYGWYDEISDSVWQNDDSYFRNGFYGSIPSSNHGLQDYSYQVYEDWDDGELNGNNKYPPTGTADLGVAMQWNIGDLGPGESWEITLTFEFGGAAGIQADAGPDQTEVQGRAVTLDASNSRSIGTIVTYEWDLDNDGIYDVSTSSSVHDYPGWSELGEYIIGLRVTDDEDRQATDTVTITVVPDVDLTILNITFSPSTGINDGDIMIFSATVSNIGAGAFADDFFVRFEIDDGYIGGERVSGGLFSGGSAQVLQNWEADAGNHTVKAIVDYYNEIMESNETNNELSRALPEIPQPPEVNVTSPNGGEVWYGARDFTWEASSPEGLDLTIKIELYNGYSYKLIADGLPNTGVYHNWDTSKFADGSQVPDSPYNKIRITATDSLEVSSSDLSDNWYTIWNTPIVEISYAPSSQSTTENVNAAYTLTIVNKQPSADTFDLLIDNTNNAAVVELSQNTVEINQWESATVTLDVTDETAGTYQVTIRAVSQTNPSITDSVTITTYVRDAFTIAISAPRTQTSIGGTLTYRVEVVNNQGSSDTFTLNVNGIDETWFSIDSSCQLTAGESKTIPLEILIPDTASAGEFSIVVKATSTDLATTKEALASLNVSATPLIFDLTPAHNTRTGSTDVLFSWRTSVNSTSDVFIKAEGEADYTLVRGERDLSHNVYVNGLTRNIWYDFYIRSESAHGSAQSEIRRIFIDNGITFSQRTYDSTIERDYNQERTITVINTDDEPHEVLLNVSRVPEDLVINFVGEGSMDQVILLHPGERKDIAIVLHAQDAQAEEYTILLNLANLGATEITDYAYLKLHVHIPVINFTIEEISSDPYTLAKTFRVKNYGDSLTDLSITADENLANILMFQPSISHGYLGTGSSLEFNTIPMLSLDFAGATGVMFARAAGHSVNATVDFTLPEGTQIFTGRVPNTNISYSTMFDEDEWATTNPIQDNLVPSYMMKGRVLFTGRVMVTVLQDGNPASYGLAKLTMRSGITETTSEAWTDRWGHALFYIYGYADTYTYYVELPGYDLSTEIRTFTVNATSSYEVTQDISWVRTSDANSTFTFPREDGFIALDASPYVLEATKEDIAHDTRAILYLQPYVAPEEPEVVRVALRMTTIEMRGSITGNVIRFSANAVAPGNYTAVIFTYSSTEISMSTSINVTLTDEPWLRGALNYTIQIPLALNSTHYYDVGVFQEVVQEDPKKIIDLWYVQPSNSSTMLLFTYMVKATEDMVDTAVIEATDNISGEVFYREIRDVTLKANVPQLLNVFIPAYENDRIKRGFDLNFTMLDPGGVIHHVYEDIRPTDAAMGLKVHLIGEMPPGAYGSGGPSVMTQAQGFAVVKCAAGFIPGVGLAINAYDFVANLWKMDSGAFGNAGQIVLDDIVQKRLVKGAVKWGFEEGVRGSLKLGAKWVPFIGSLYGCVDDFTKATTGKGILEHGIVYVMEKNDWYCTNRPEVKTTFSLPSTLHSPNLAGGDYRNGQFYYKSLPAKLMVRFTLPWNREAYKPHDVHIHINDVKVGSLLNITPEGIYTFDFDPRILNFAEEGVAKNEIYLETLHLNGGHYIVTGEFTIILGLRQVSMPVIASSQDEADQTVQEYLTGIGNQPDLRIYPEGIKLSEEIRTVGEATEISANVYNFGSTTGTVNMVFTLSGPTTETLNTTISYVPSFGNATAKVYWTPKAQGTYSVNVNVNPDRIIQESRYTNNEATKAISVTAPDTTPPVINNPLPEPDSTTSDNPPLISADLSDSASVINTLSGRMTLNGMDVTENTTVISSRIWYTPDQPLDEGMYEGMVYIEDNSGNNNTLTWEFYVGASERERAVVNVEAPNEVYVGEVFTVEAAVSYEFTAPTETRTRIYDEDAGTWITTESETLLGAGTKTYSFELTAPQEATTWALRADVWYYLEDEWIHDEVDWSELFDIQVKEESGETYSASVIDLEAPGEVYVGDVFTVDVTVSYEFAAPTEMSPGIYDEEAETWVAVEFETLVGAGSKTYSFELTAPQGGMTWELEADVLYMVDDTWLFDEGSSMFFSVKVVSGDQNWWDWILELPIEYLAIIGLGVLILMILLLKWIF